MDGDTIGYAMTTETPMLDRPPGVTGHLERIDGMTSMLEESLHRLVGALDPVLLPPSDRLTVRGEQVVPHGSRIAELLDGHEDRLQRLVDIASDAFERLHL